jgi:hypothetical protein
MAERVGFYYRRYRNVRDAYTFMIIPCVYAGYKHIRTQAEVSTVYAIPRSPTKNGITGISRQGLRL